MTRAIALTNSRCLRHAPAGFPERPERLERLISELPGLGFPPAEAGSHEAARESVEAVHDAMYVTRFEQASERGDGLLDSADNPLSEGTWAAAWAAVETALVGADRMAEERVPVFAAIRPPGHHAERDRAMGFCFFNNIAVAADYLVRSRGLERLAIFDFDVHHGNGTQHLFEKRPDVFFVSTHQYPFYPGTGSAAEQGRGEGVGATLNLPLAAGTGDSEIRQVVEEQVLPSLSSYAPDALLVSAGFDAWQSDPIGGLRWSEDIYRWLGVELGGFAAQTCGGRLLSVLEGGYDIESLPRLVAAYLGGQSAAVL